MSKIIIKVGVFSRALFVLLVVGGLLAPQWSKAAEPRAHSIQINGRGEITVTQGNFSLGDLAEVYSPERSDDTAVIQLKKIVIDRSPRAGEALTVSAMTVVDKLRSAGVDLSRVGYTFPRTMQVRRAGRSLALEEIKAAIDAYAKLSGKDLNVRDVQLKRPIFVAPSTSRIEARPFTLAAPGKMGFTIAVDSPDEPQVKFDVEAGIDEWGEIPVARRAFARGEIVQPDDVMMARMNLASVPRDALRSGENLVGLSTASEVSYGETFRRAKLVLPIAIEKDSRVTAVYRSGGLQATLRGVALDSAAIGQEIRIRNDTSKKIISGKVKEAGIVEVLP